MRHHHHDRHPARAVHPRPADPETTRQAREVIAMVKHTCPDPAVCGYDILRDFYAKDVARHLPDIDPALLGRILLTAGATIAAGMRLLGLDIDHGTSPAEYLAADAVTLLGVAAGRMYLDATGQTETEH